MRSRAFWLLSLLVAGPLGASMARAEAEFIRDVEYCKGGGRALRLDIIRPFPAPREPMPAVIWIHGGAWREGDKSQTPLLPLAQRGYFTASINYRLSDDAPFPAAVEDCKCAVRWLRANAEKYHVDPDRIGAWGASAGGHLAELLATTAGLPEFEGAGGWKDASSRVSAVVSFFGPSDFTRGWAGFSPGVLAAGIAFLGGGPEQRADVYRRASPITHVSKNAAPMLLVHGDADRVVPLEQSTRMAEALKAAGAEYKLIVVRNGGHGFSSGVSPSLSEIERAVIDWFDIHLKPK